MSTTERVVFLRGRKTILRPPTKSDVPLILRWINNPDVRVFLSTVRPITEVGEAAWIESLAQQESEVVLLIETTDRVPIGMMGLHRIDPVHRTAMTGAYIGETAYWGKGYGQDAKMAMLEYAFHTLNLRKINSQTYSFNRRSAEYNMRCGYRIEGRLKRQFFRKGRYYDTILLCVFREWWEPKWKKYRRTGRL